MKKMGSEEMLIGGVIGKGVLAGVRTGDWKSFKPVKNDKKCTNCLLCALYCPEACIKARNGKVSHPDLNYCKGCGICANQCPVKAIEMKKLEECDL